MKNNIAIQLTNVSKQYTIHHEKPTLVEKFYTSSRLYPHEKFWALKKINLSIHKGDKVGIIGPNGSGKTTLLKIITGITSPTTGEVITNGKVVSLIDLEAGFHPDLSGYQNVYLNGMLLGMSHRDINRKLKSIIQFADIKQFIDAPLFSYSSGMKLRLGFSVAIHANPDILILDEGISVGDDNFQKKSLEKIQEFIQNNKTVLFASHWIDYVKKNCPSVIALENGNLIHYGPTKDFLKG